MKRKIYIAAVAVLVLISMLTVLITSHKIEEKKNVITTTTTTTTTTATSAATTTVAEKETTTTTKKTTTKKTTTTKPKTTTTTTSAATTTVAAIEEPVETYLEEPIETYEAYSEEPVEEIYYGDYSPYDLQSIGVINWGSYRYTYYSENVLPGYGLQIEGRHTDEYGFVCDGDGYICVASSSLPWGTVVDTPFGRAGKVYDSGCAWDVIDIYVNW